MLRDSKFILRAIAFTLLINLASVIEFVRFEGFSFRSFSEPDETLYLLDSLELAGAGFKDVYVYGTPDSTNFLVADQPHALAKVLAGGLGRILGLTPVGLGLLLDITCSFTSYILFTRCFLCFTPWRREAEAAAVVFLALPAFGGCLRLFDPEGLFFSRFQSASISAFRCLPILRSVSTQLSYPVLALFLRVLFSWKAAEPVHRSRPWLLGFLAGGMLYVYFFAWCFAVVFASIYFAYTMLCDARNTRESSLQYLARFFAAWGLASLPGLYILFGKQFHFTYTLPPSVSLPICLSPGMLIVAVFLFWAKQNLMKDTMDRRLSELLLAAIIAFIVLMNIQLILNEVVTPYHFNVLYIDPLIGSLLFIFLGRHLTSERVKFMAHAIIIAVVVVISAIQVKRNLTNGEWFEDFSALGRHLYEQTPPGTRIAMLPVHNAFRTDWRESPMVRIAPLALQSTSQRPIFTVDKAPNDYLEIWKRELYIGYLYSGVLQPLVRCDGGGPSLPGDLSMGVVTWCHIFGYNICRKFSGQAMRTPEELAAEYHVDLIISEPSLYQLKDAGGSLWKSPNGFFSIHKPRM